MDRIAAVVALKPITVAKSRLGDIAVPLRERLARAMALDTLAALAAAGALVVVVGDPSSIRRILAHTEIPAEVVPEPRPGGLNRALQAGAEAAHSAGCDRVLACVGDLPALTADGVGEFISTVDDQHRSRAFVPDRSGIGTTMLLATGADLDPHFGERSADDHRASGASAITVDEYPELRADVDTVDDLASVIMIGVGRHTAALIDPAEQRIADYHAVTVMGPAPADPPAQHGAQSTYAVVTDAGFRLDLPADRVDPQIRFLRPGQRLHATVVGSRLISAWW